MKFLPFLSLCSVYKIQKSLKPIQKLVFVGLFFSLPIFLSLVRITAVVVWRSSKCDSNFSRIVAAG